MWSVTRQSKAHIGRRHGCLHLSAARLRNLRDCLPVAVVEHILRLLDLRPATSEAVDQKLGLHD